MIKLKCFPIVNNLWIANTDAIIRNSQIIRTLQFESIIYVGKYPKDNILPLFPPEHRNKIVYYDSLTVNIGEILERIDDHLLRHKKICIVCETASQRSTSVVVCYLIKYAHLDANTIIKSIKTKNPDAFHNNFVYKDLFNYFQKKYLCD